MVTTTSKTIVISGYYGFKNSGDEAVLKSILTALEQEGQAAGVTINPVVLSIDPEWTKATYGVKSVHRMKLGEVRQAIKESDGLISGGGSLLQDATSPKTIPYYLGILKIAQWLGKPTFIYAQGVGPVNRKLFHPMIRSVFRKCSYISVRDAQSGELLQTMGISTESIQVVPDPVMGLPLPGDMQKHSNGAQDEAAPEGTQAERVAGVDGQAAPLEADSSTSGAAASAGQIDQGEGHLPTIGISVRRWHPELKELQSIADGLKELAASRKVHLRFLPFHKPDDLEASRYIADLVGDVRSNGSEISYYLEEQQPQDMLREVSRCDVVLGMRLHSLIYAANRRVPLLGISYDPKIDHFLKRLGCEPVGSSEALDPARLKSEIAKLLDGGQAWVTEHEAPIAELKREAALPARRIVEYLRHRG
ncbi:polysaccharide pyruvyl transferase CsaB [Paenibacillus lactis]|uniref:polysaccharide pyruvyl transferase CsaB n=1 Tax=Paenibacillus lactis TaxID=228574 RepID=UPI003691F711